MHKILKKYHPIPTILSGFFILLVCLLPGSSIPKSGFLEAIFFDKWVHLTMYFVWTYVWFIGLNRIPTLVFLGSILVFVVLFGAAIEIMQENFVVARSAEWADWIADVFGTIIGYAFALKWLKKIQQKSD